MLDTILALNSIILIIGYVLLSGVFLFLVLLVIRHIIQRSLKRPSAFHMVVLQILIPKEGQEDESSQPPSGDQIKEKISVAEVFFATLGGVKAQRGFMHFLFGRNDHLSLEIVADKEGQVTFYAAVPRYMKQYFEHQIQAQYETAEIYEVEDYNIFDPQGAIVASSLKLDKDQMFAIQTYDKMESDPLNAITNVLSKFEKNEGAAIQFVIRSAKADWHEYPSKVAHTMQQGKSMEQAYNEVMSNIFVKAFREIWHTFFPKKSKRDSGIDPQTDRDYRLSPMEDQIVKSLEEKTSKSGFDVNIRVIASGPSPQQAESKLMNILNVFSQYAGYQYGNKFVASKPSDKQDLVNSFIYRTFDSKHSFVLNTKEMASLWHLPLPTTETPNIRWLMARKSAPPANMPKEGIIIGKVKYRSTETMVRIKRADRRRHMYVIGKSGSGKSVLLTQMALQDIQNGEGVGVIDPHGELVEDILPHIPKERIDDVIIFDPSDSTRPMGLNMLEYENDEQKDFAVQEMVAIFYKLFGQEMIGPMFEHYMRNAMLALMEDKEAGATLIEIPRMFTDDKFRKEKVAKVKNMIVKNFWEQEYEQSQAGQSAADMLSYVISKIGRFLTNDMMRNIIGQSRSAFNLRDVMDNQKILLVNLSKGKIGEVNSSLLGLIMVSKIQMAAMARADMPKEKRKDFYLYMDEFQNFSTDSIATILSEARKYLLNLIMAHQYIAQLTTNNDTKIRDAVFGNAGTMAAFRVGAEDAEFLEKEFIPVFNKNDIINVEQYTANIKLLIDNTASRPFNMNTILPPDGNRSMSPLLRELSRMKYGRDRQEVEDTIRERAQWDKLGGGGMTGPESFI
ncbi:MAG: type IV secretory system conjugative DNA transfer family protein [Candidatus Kerfeldbacteria bacterium]|nr:type IV secretory system conjugative DNA transfer family protein [Candidatus Kerfeldbacteria bacterium]